MVEFFNSKGIGYFQTLDIFDCDWLKHINTEFRVVYKDPRKIHIRLLHKYLDLTDKYSTIFIIRAIDKVLKKIL
jgi:hypothetical protein